MRLDKFLTEQGIGSRSQVKQLIKKGYITVNNMPCKVSDMKIDENNDVIKYNGRVLSYQKFHYYMLNKPAGVVSATSDNANDTVLSLLHGINIKGLFPVGRLDKDTEGLLLITDDGQLSHNLLSPAKHVNKTYFAVIDSAVTDDDVLAFKEGVDIGDEKLTKPAELQILNSEHSDQDDKPIITPALTAIRELPDHSGTEVTQILLTITEGRFHQVKRMFQAVGKNVIYLKRISMGHLTLDPTLKSGEFRELTPEEVYSLTDKEPI